MKKKVYLIYTGGTIGMTNTVNGYAPKKGFLQQEMADIKALSSSEMPHYTLNEYEPLLDSSNISVREWIKIARDIRDHYEDYDGFVILHGTDTMAYTASALSFMLEGLAKPVILTGSQIPLCEIRNDARDNLITALLLAGNYDIKEVCLFFGTTLLRGNRSTKVSASGLSAFESPNDQPLGTAGVDIIVDKARAFACEESTLKLFEFTEQQIAVLKIFPGIQPEIFDNIITTKLKGLVIEAFGSGNIPSTDGRLQEIFKRAADNGTVIVVCTQCLRGGAVIGEYEASKGLADAGAISGYDMTVEAAVAKLYYLLSKGYDSSQIRELMQTDLRGEITRGKSDSVGEIRRRKTDLLEEIKSAEVNI